MLDKKNETINTIYDSQKFNTSEDKFEIIEG